MVSSMTRRVFPNNLLMSVNMTWSTIWNDPTQTPAQQQTRPSENTVIDDQYIERDDQFLNFRVTILTRERYDI